MILIDSNKETCVSCGKQFLLRHAKYTFRNGEYLAFCRKCWDAALKVQEQLTPPDRAKAAQERYNAKK